MLVGQIAARSGLPGVDADDPHPLLLGPLEVLQGVRAERPVGRAPAPHHDQLRVEVVGGLAPGALVLRLGAVGHVHREDLRLRRHVRPELRAAAEHVEEALGRGAVVEHGQVARAGGVEDGGVAVRVPDAQHLARHLVERGVPRDRLEPARAARSRPAQRLLQAVGMIDALDLAEAADAGVERGQLERPLPRVGGDLHDAAVHHVGVDDAAPSAVVAAGAGDDGLALAGGDARSFVDGARGQGVPPGRPAYHARERRRSTRVAVRRMSDPGRSSARERALERYEKLDAGDGEAAQAIVIGDEEVHPDLSRAGKLDGIRRPDVPGCVESPRISGRSRDRTR